MFEIKSKSKQFLALAVVFNVAAIALYAALFLQVKGKNEQISSLVNQIELDVAQESLLSSIKELVSETAPLREKLSGYFVPKDGVVAFIESLEKLGRETGVAVAMESVEVESKEDADVEELRLVMRFEGSWQSVVGFVGLLELFPVEGRFERVAVSQSKAGEGWRGDVALRALKQK